MNDALLIDQIVDYAVFKHYCNYRVVVPEIGFNQYMNAKLLDSKKECTNKYKNMDFVPKPFNETKGLGKPDKICHGLEIYYLQKNITFEKYIASNKSYDIYFLLKELFNIEYSQELKIIVESLPRLSTELYLWKNYKEPLSKDTREKLKINLVN